MKHQTIKVCCSVGNPSSVGGCGDYTARGQVFQLPDNGPSAYVTEPSDSNATNRGAIVALYDIFGLNIIQTRRFVDSLASATSMRVVMPDVFRGKPWPLEKFPPKDFTEYKNWVETAGTWDVVAKDIVACHKFLLSKGLQECAPLGILGFCWGGARAMQACCGDTYGRLLGGIHVAGGVALHAAFFGPEDAERVTVPMLLMPSGSDPEIEPIKAIWDRKPFGSRCGYKRFDGEVHGFAAARGDWDVNHTREAILEAIKLSAEFFVKNLLS